MEKIKFLFLFLFTITSSLLIAQTEEKPVIIKKQLVTDEVIYQDIALTGISSFFISPIFSTNYSIENLADKSYDSIHTYMPSINVGFDYKIVYNNWFVKTGISYKMIRESKIQKLHIIVNDSVPIDSLGSYLLTKGYIDREKGYYANYSYLTIPLTFGKIFRVGKIGISPEIGIDFDMVIAASGYSGANAEDKIAMKTEYLNSVSRIFIGNSFSYEISKNLEIYLQPWFNYSLKADFNSSYAAPSFKTNTYGCKLGINFK